MNLRLSRSIRSSIYRFIHDEMGYKKLQFDEFVDLWGAKKCQGAKMSISSGRGDTRQRSKFSKKRRAMGPARRLQGYRIRAIQLA
jgi:hypothetical protein